MEIELESLKQSGKENLQQAIQMERENFTHMLWDMEELRRKCVEMELNLTSEQVYSLSSITKWDISSISWTVSKFFLKIVKADKVQMESTQRITIQENERLYEELSAAQQQINSLRKHHLESESKSKADVKLLIKEIKSLRTSQTEQKQELCKLAKEKAEVEVIIRLISSLLLHSHSFNELDE